MLSIQKSQNHQRSFRIGNSSLAHESRYGKWNHKKINVPQKTINVNLNVLDLKLKSKNIRVKTVPACQRTNLLTKNEDYVVYTSLNEEAMFTQKKFYQTKFKMNQVKTNLKIKEFAYQSINGGRIYNQDRILTAPGTIIKGQLFDIFAVFDGHGGSYVSQYLKLNFVNLFQESYKKQFTMEQCIRNSILKCEANIKVLSQKYHKALISGSCAIIAIIYQNHIYIVNVGDSRALKVDSKGRTTPLSEDHKPESQSQKCRIQNLGGKIYRNKIIQNGKEICGPFRVYPGKLSVSRTLGDFGIKKQMKEEIISSIPDISIYQVQSNSKILLISDGVYELLSNDQISKHFQNTSSQKGVRSLMRKVQHNNTSDNCSIVAITFA